MILFVVEGGCRELDVFSSISRQFFERQGVVTITIPAEMNIYMLYEKQKKEGFATDLLSLLIEASPTAAQKLADYTRDSFSETYLFFDYDLHANNLKGGADQNIVLKEMLEFYQNETEERKLYISYPMIEALRDFAPCGCATMNGSCFIKAKDYGDYKHMSSRPDSLNNFALYHYAIWSQIVLNFYNRLACLFEVTHLDRGDYMKFVTPMSIYEKQIKLNNNYGTFVLSSIPEFLLDYHKEKFWNSIMKRNVPADTSHDCPKYGKYAKKGE